MFRIGSASLLRRQIGVSMLLIEGDDPGLEVFQGKSLVFSRDKATLRFGAVGYETVSEDVFAELFSVELPHEHLARLLMAQHGLDVVFVDQEANWRELYMFSSVRWGRIAPTFAKAEIDEAQLAEPAFAGQEEKK